MRRNSPVMLNLFQHPSCATATTVGDEGWTLKQVQGDEEYEGGEKGAVT